MRLSCGKDLRIRQPADTVQCTGPKPPRTGGLAHISSREWLTGRRVDLDDPASRFRFAKRRCNRLFEHCVDFVLNEREFTGRSLHEYVSTPRRSLGNQPDKFLQLLGRRFGGAHWIPMNLTLLWSIVVVRGASSSARTAISVIISAVVTRILCCPRHRSSKSKLNRRRAPSDGDRSDLHLRACGSKVYGLP
jgi:hypothetical protein